MSKTGEGAPKELLSTELPTLRAVLLLGIHLQEQRITLDEVDKRNYTVKELCFDLADKVLAQWVKANALFVFPVIINKKSLSTKILTDWQMAQKVSNNKGTKKEIEKFDEKLDKLYDLTKCRCQMILVLSLVSVLTLRRNAKFVPRHLPLSQ